MTLEVDDKMACFYVFIQLTLTYGAAKFQLSSKLTEQQIYAMMRTIKGHHQQLKTQIKNRAM